MLCVVGGGFCFVFVSMWLIAAFVLLSEKLYYDTTISCVHGGAGCMIITGLQLIQL